ncbi:MAG: hypothetical protein RJA61_668 [Candidatus Parcubacteria bacterium]|jgi:putative ABC transport system ATP-binding protein
MIEVSNLSKSYIEGDAQTNALLGVNFTIGEGDFVSIMGPSGSGKSTLLHVLSFLDRPTDGTYTFLGKNINHLSDSELAQVRNQEMGFIFQSFNLLGRSTVYENVELPLFYSPMPVSKRKEAIEQAVYSVGLQDKLNTPAGNLSGGQKQRVAIARALVNEPAIIFADEPTGNLDSASGEQVMEILRELNNLGRTIILVTHETYTANYGKRLLKLRDGQLESDTPIERVSEETYFK